MRKTIRIITAVMLIIMMTATSFALAEIPEEQPQNSSSVTEVSDEAADKTDEKENPSELSETEDAAQDEEVITETAEGNTEDGEVSAQPEEAEAPAEETTVTEEAPAEEAGKVSVKTSSPVRKSAAAVKSAGSGEPFALKSISWKMTSYHEFFGVGYHQRKITHINDTDVNSTNDMKSSYAFCVEPNEVGPEGWDAGVGASFKAEDGKNGIRIHTFNADNAGDFAMMRKMCYYLPGSYGWNSKTSKWYKTYMNSVSENDFTEYTLSATILAKQWAKDADDPEGNANYGYRSLSDKGKELVDKFLREVPALADPPADFLAFYVEKENTQDIWGSLYAEPESGEITLTKKSAYPSLTDALPGNYSLQGAKYYVYTDSSCKTRAKDLYDNDIVLETDKKGSVKAVGAAVGDYWIKEVSASKGFSLDKNVYHVKVTSDKTSEAASTEQPVYASFTALLEKQSEEYGYRRLTGAEYTLTYYDVDPSTKDVSGLKPAKTWVFRTREGKDPDSNASVACIDFSKDKPVSGGSMYKAGDNAVMPLGVFTLKETKAPKGLAADPNTYLGCCKASGDSSANVTINGSDTLYVDYSGRFRLLNTELEKTVKLIIQKKDAETGKTEPQGQESESRKAAYASLEGAVYKVYMNDPAEDEDPEVGEMITDQSGRAELSTDKRTGKGLMPGIYYIKEIKASPGYVADSLTEKEQKNKYQDGMHIVKARADDDPDTSVCEYTIDSMEAPHHTLIHKTDVTTGKELPGAKLQVLDSEGNIVEEWVSTDKPHDIIALPDGKYTLRELTAPYGYEIREDAVFEVTADKVISEAVMKNQPVNVTTTAKHAATDAHSGAASGEAKITDTVKMEGLCKNGTYRIEGTLMDRRTGKPVTDEKGEPLTEEAEFAADAENVSVDLLFGFDQKKFSKGATVVVFEKLYRVEAPDEGGERKVTEIQKHEDINNEDQSIHYGGIASTEATDRRSSTHNISPDRETVIVDHVKYSNLSVKDSYILTGELYDKTTGKLTGIKATGEFSPEASEGQTQLEFCLDTSELQDHTLVVFEKLYVRTSSEDKTVLIDTHENPDDKAQTVHVDKRPAGPKTGDNTVLRAYLMLGAAALSSLILMIRKSLE